MFRPPRVGPGWRRVLPELAVFVFFFALYAYTLSPDVLPADSGEFQVVAPLMGVAHPPGYVLYTLIGKAFVTLVPFGSAAYRLNLLSALTGALTLAFVCKAIRTRPSCVPRANGGLVGDWVPALAAAALGVSTTFWSLSTTANVRSLAGLFTALALWCLAEIRASKDGARLDGESASPSALSSGARLDSLFVLLVSLGVLHHASFAFVAGVFGLYWLSLRAGRLRQPGWWIRNLSVAAAPLLLLIYLPIRGVQGAFLAPPGLNSVTGLLEHVLALGFGGDLFYFAKLDALPDRLSILWTILEFQLNPLILLLVLVGWIAGLARDWKWALTLGLAFAVHSFVAMTYRAPQTVEYLLSAYLLMAAALGMVGTAALPQASETAREALGGHSLGRPPARRWASAASALGPAAFAAAALGTLLLFLQHLPSYRFLARDHSAREYAAGVLSSAPPDAVVFSVWHWATPMWYLQRVEGMRPDVDVRYVYPEGESLAATWVKRIGDEVGRRPVLVTAFFPQEYASTGYRFLPMGEAWRVLDSPIAELPAGFTKASVAFGSKGWRLAGYQLEAVEAEPGGSFPVSVAWLSPSSPEDIHFFVQLIGPDGALYGQVDFSHPAGSYRPGETLVNRGEITVRLDAVPGDYRLIGGAYLNDGSRLTAPSQDHWPLGTVRVLTASAPPVSAHPTLRPVGQAWLVGSDFDHSLPDSVRLYLHWKLSSTPQTVVLWADGSAYAVLDLPPRSTETAPYLTTATELPIGMHKIDLVPDGARAPEWFDVSLSDSDHDSRYVPLGGSVVLIGASVRQVREGEWDVDLEWLSSRPLTRDLVAKVDLTDTADGWKTTSDSIPAGGAIPTLKWVYGSAVSDRHRLSLPADRIGSETRLDVGMYDYFTQQPLPILDPRLAMHGPTVTLEP